MSIHTVTLQYKKTPLFVKCSLKTFSSLLFLPPACSLTESPYKVVVEQLVSPAMAKTSEEQERQVVLQRPLEICLKHSTVHSSDSSSCPLVRPQPGVAALHEYAEWISELNDERGDVERKTI